MLICLIFLTRSLGISSSLYIDGVCVVALAHATNTMSGVAPSCYDVVDEWLIFCGFLFKGLCGKYVITICKCYKLYDELWCMGLWWEVIVQEANEFP